MEHRKQFEDSYQQELEKTLRDLNRLKLKMKQFDNCGDYEAVETYVAVIHFGLQTIPFPPPPPLLPRLKLTRIGVRLFRLSSSDLENRIDSI